MMLSRLEQTFGLDFQKDLARLAILGWGDLNSGVARMKGGWGRTRRLPCG